MSSKDVACATDSASGLSSRKLVAVVDAQHVYAEDELENNVESSSSSSLSPDMTCVSVPESTMNNTFRMQPISASTSFYSQSEPFSKIQIPIVGYEVMEERARFTVYKLRIEKSSGECWFVFRRYTDFLRLHSKLKHEFPTIKLVLPQKRWFGDNFDPTFIEGRIHGLQNFVNAILEIPELYSVPTIKNFFCLDEPPSYAESMESRAIFESLEEIIYHLRHVLKGQDIELGKLKSKLASESVKNEVLCDFIRNCTKNCSQCKAEFLKVANSEDAIYSLPVTLHNHTHDERNSEDEHCNKHP